MVVVGLTLTATGIKVTVAEADFVVSAWLVAVTVAVCSLAIVEGAEYKPLALTVPAPLTVHVTAVLLVLVTVAANCCVWLPYSVVVVGLTLTATGGISVTVAAADFALSAWLVAVTVAVCWLAIMVGAVYRPLALTVPAPLTVHVTAVLVVFVTVAVNCCVPDWYSDTADGASVTEIGLIVYVAELTALFNSPLLYATALIVVVTPTVIGPVYSAPIVSLGTLPSVV